MTSAAFSQTQTHAHTEPDGVTLGYLAFAKDDFAAARDHWQFAFHRQRAAGHVRAAARTGANLALLYATVLGNEALAAGWLARARMKAEGLAPRGQSWHDMWLTYFKKPHNHRFEGHSVAEVAELTGKDEVDTMCDLLLEEDLQVSFISAGVNPLTLSKFIAHPMSMVGSDALLIGDFPSPRTYGCFPVILSEYVREEHAMSFRTLLARSRRSRRNAWDCQTAGCCGTG